ncbi:MAG: hypothetical protein IKD08_01820 [Alphaproteobacteria bacterium]|nr:hypothetical protein [Alphaproteobacteria bacterium]
MLNLWVYKPNPSATITKDVFALIAGPGGMAFNKEHINKITQTLKNADIETLLIGDGINPISEDILSKLSAYKNSRHMTVMFLAHGYRTEKSEHILWLGESANTRTKELISSLSKMRRNKSTDFILTSSYGAALLPQIYKKMPKKSRITVLAPDENLLTGDQLTAMIEHICRKLPSAFSGTEDALNAYLCAIQAKTAPQFAIARKGLFNPHKQLLSRLGKPFSIEEKITIYQTLGKSLSAKRLQELEKTIENAKTECEISAKDFGEALAMCNVITESHYNKRLLSRLFSTPKSKL